MFYATQVLLNLRALNLLSFLANSLILLRGGVRVAAMVQNGVLPIYHVHEALCWNRAPYILPYLHLTDFPESGLLHGLVSE